MFELSLEPSSLPLIFDSFQLHESLHFSLLSFTISDINLPRNEVLEINANSVPPFISLAQIRCIDRFLLPGDNLHFDLGPQRIASSRGEEKINRELSFSVTRIRNISRG